MGRMGSKPILIVKQPVTIGTRIKLDGDLVGDGVGTCKQALSDKETDKMCCTDILQVFTLHRDNNTDSCLDVGQCELTVDCAADA